MYCAYASMSKRVFAMILQQCQKWVRVLLACRTHKLQCLPCHIQRCLLTWILMLLHRPSLELWVLSTVVNHNNDGYNKNSTNNSGNDNDNKY